ncbi:MAG: hypothetical protein NT030_06920 [Candidatus Saganbacteria bacterium]|nr:hypothetical protein [Candidatus Saganbacteria bacterium]
MAKISNLFYSLDPEKITLHRRIIPSQKQQESQQERWTDLCEYLIGDLNEDSGHKISSWLQGSYKFKTQVRPAHKGGEFDIDVGIYFNWRGSPKDGKYSPRELKSFVQASLLRYKDEAEDVIEVISPPKERCSRIRFPGDFHIDVPSYHLDDERDARALATEHEDWEYSDPKALYLWFRKQFSDEENSQARRLTQYVKIWAALQLKETPSSVLLTVLVAEAYLKLVDKDGDGDDTALRNVCEQIVERLEIDSQVCNPVDTNENLNRLTKDETDSFIEKLHEIINIADRALAVSTEFESAIIWSEAFYHFFPIPVEDYADPKNRALIPVSFMPDVQIRAVPRDNKYRQYNGQNRIGPIPKKCDIYFTLTNVKHLPAGASVQWIVRNEGEEAEYINDLGHLAGLDPKEAKESSAYKGTHYMDVVVTSSMGEVLGFRRLPVEVSGYFMPPRNPKRPGYTRFRKRK